MTLMGAALKGIASTLCVSVGLCVLLLGDTRDELHGDTVSRLWLSCSGSILI